MIGNSAGCRNAEPIEPVLASEKVVEDGRLEEAWTGTCRGLKEAFCGVHEDKFAASNRALVGYTRASKGAALPVFASTRSTMAR